MLTITPSPCMLSALDLRALCALPTCRSVRVCTDYLAFGSVGAAASNRFMPTPVASTTTAGAVTIPLVDDDVYLDATMANASYYGTMNVSDYGVTTMQCFLTQMKGAGVGPVDVGGLPSIIPVAGNPSSAPSAGAGGAGPSVPLLPGYDEAAITCYKYVAWSYGGRELYDLGSDPAEVNDL